MKTRALALALVLVACGDDTPATRDTSVAPDTSVADSVDDTALPSDTSGADSTPDVDDAVDDSSPTTTTDAVVTDVAEDVDSGCAPAVCAALAEQRAARELDEIQDDSAALEAYLRDVPKGGDLHHHLSGAVWAEQYLEMAQASGGYCIDTRTSSYLSLSTSCGGTSAAVPSPGDDLYDDVIAEWSMEGFVASASETGHDHFFSTFGKFGAISGNHHGEMLADVMRRAGSENQVYIELMLTSNSTAATLGDDTWDAKHPGATFNQAQLATFYGDIKAASGLNNAINRITTDVNASESEARQILGCGTASPQPGCSVATRYQVFISRSGSQTGVYARIIVAFEAGIRDPRVVGVNLVGPEDNPAALSRYDFQMQMLGYLYGQYVATGASPVKISLHAGELTDPYTPDNYPLATINHIQKAVDIAHAARIGHGVDIFSETDPDGIIDRLRENNVLVEICLASNDQILELSGPDHPLRDYIDAGVPVALGTDDQGVARSSMAAEYRRAVLDQGLDYYRLKRMARDSIELSFLGGESLWFSLDDGRPVEVCDPSSEGGVLGVGEPSDECKDFLAGNDRAKVELDLEQRFRAFEAAR